MPEDLPSEKSFSISDVALPLIIIIGTILLGSAMGFAWPITISVALGAGGIFAIAFHAFKGSRECGSHQLSSSGSFIPKDALMGPGEMETPASRVKNEVYQIGSQSIRHLRSEDKAKKKAGKTKTCKDAIGDEGNPIARLVVQGDGKIERTQKEIGFLEELQGCPGIVQYIGKGEKTSKLGNLKLSVYLPWYNEGDLIDFGVERLYKLPREQKLQIAKVLLEALAAMHKQGISHNDIKFENILIRSLPGSRVEVAICDFDLASRQDSRATLGGTLQYCSPEKFAIVEREEDVIPRAGRFCEFGLAPPA